jgi:Spy/CpxP family protein refolding chaperone
MRDEMTKIQREREKEIKTVLTPEQVKQYDEILKKREEMRKNNQGRWGGGAPGQ